MISEATSASSSPELWERLIAGGDLQPDGYDQPLVDELRRRLHLPEALSMPQALAGTPIEHFVAAFFEVNEPFVEMWEDLLALFERAAASTGSQQLDIAYDFSSATRPRKLRFTLDHFRKTIARVRQLMVRFDLSRAGADDLWKLVHAYEGTHVGRRNAAHSNPDIARFARACRQETYPDRMPARPTSSDARLDALVSETWALGGVILADLRAVFGDHRSLAAAFRRESQSVPVPSGLAYRELLMVESDFWLTALVEAAAVELANPHQPTDHLAHVLDTLLEPLRNHDPSLRVPQERLEELLSLPLWKHRYDLYANWVTTQVVAALDDQAPRLHAAAGAISFSFRGTHLATFDAPMPRIHLWTEYRSDFKDRAFSGGGLTTRIQPDIVLCRDPITAKLIPLVVECKQYRKADNQAFATALKRYARGHRDATVVVVNYAGGREPTILSRVPPEVRDRTAFIPYLRPNSPAALARFRRIVRASIGLTDDPDDAS